MAGDSDFRMPVDSPDHPLRAALAARVGPAAFDLWFRNHTRFENNDSALVVCVPNAFFQGFLEHQYGSAIREVAGAIYGDQTLVQFAVDASLSRTNRDRQESAKPQGETATAEPAAVPASSDREPTVPPRSAAPAAKRRWRTLKDFVVGGCNRVAFAAAQSIIDEPGAQSNPLVFYGPVGTGKTHLLEGIYAGLRQRHPSLRIQFVTAEDFTNRFVASVQHKKQHSFRRQFRQCSVLLVDDLNFLAAKRATQIEFQHTFDALLADGAQIVAACDCHPRLTDDLMPELVDRLVGGAVWSLMPPDAETRLSILKHKAAPGNPPLSEAILKFLAEKLRGNVRELEGAILNIRHYARATNRTIDLDLVREALGDLLRHAIRVVSIADVDTAVTAALHLPVGAIKSKAKTWSVSHPRMIAIYLCRKHTAATFGEIGVYFNNKTHSAAVAAEKRVRGWIETNERVKTGDRDWPIRELIERIEHELNK